jgi:hypothetical protein
LTIGYRLGLRPWEIERLQPVDLWEMSDGAQWRRNRDLAAVATSLWYLRAHGMEGTDKPKPEQLLKGLPGYVEEED